MPVKMKQLMVRVAVAVLTFMISVGLTVLWVLPTFRRDKTNDIAARPIIEETNVPAALKRLEIRDKVALMVPHDMKAFQPFGDHERYRESYANEHLSITIVYDLLIPQTLTESQKQLLYSCESDRLVSKASSESVVYIDRRKAKLSIIKSSRDDSIIADLCFPLSNDLTVPLHIIATCKGDPALEVAQRVFGSITFKD